MTLTVRLDETLEAALERYCAATGASKSLVVQESLAVYLVTREARNASAQPAAAEPSDNYKAFVAAGLVGAATLPELAGGATKAAVRQRVLAKVRSREAQR